MPPLQNWNKRYGIEFSSLDPGHAVRTRSHINTPDLNQLVQVEDHYFPCFRAGNIRLRAVRCDLDPQWYSGNRDPLDDLAGGSIEDENFVRLGIRNQDQFAVGGELKAVGVLR